MTEPRQDRSSDDWARFVRPIVAERDALRSRVAELEADNDRLSVMAGRNRFDRDRLEIERDALAAKIRAVEEQREVLADQMDILPCYSELPHCSHAVWLEILPSSPFVCPGVASSPGEDSTEETP